VLTAVDGVRVGHWTDAEAGTGCTVVIPPLGTVGGVDVRGGGPGSRETDLLRPLAGVGEVTALLLTGGSAFGLAAASGVVDWCEEAGLGLDVGVARVPIVPAAVVFDLGISGNDRRPGAAEGRMACQAAREGDHEVGSVGAGTGATVGKILGAEGWCKGGLGAAAATLHDGTTVAALAVVNAFGDVLDERGEIIAGAFDAGSGFVGSARWAMANSPVHPRLGAGQHTTLACVVTDAALDKVDANRVARMGQAGLCRAVSPANTPLDGDIVFCLATGHAPANAAVVGMAAAEVVAEAIRDGVRRATSVRGVPTADQRRASGAS
jgi:L-aminopeptidase/D-esterase-like protein